MVGRGPRGRRAPAHRHGTASPSGPGRAVRGPRPLPRAARLDEPAQLRRTRPDGASDRRDDRLRGRRRPRGRRRTDTDHQSRIGRLVPRGGRGGRDQPRVPRPDRDPEKHRGLGRSRAGRLVLGDPVGAAAIARGDVLLADDVRAQDLGEQLELRLAGGRRARGDVEDRAVVLAQPDRAVGDRGSRRRDSPGRAWMTASSRTRSRSGASGATRSAICSRTRSPSWRRRAAKTWSSRSSPPTASMAASRPAARRVVVRREEVLGVGRDVVQVARPADAVAHGLAADEVGGLERPELLEDARPAGADPLGELVGRARAVESEAEQQVAAQAGWTAGGGLSKAGGDGSAPLRGRQATTWAPAFGQASTGVRDVLCRWYARGHGPRPLPGARPAPRHDPRLHADRGRPGHRRARARAALPDPRSCAASASSAGWASRSRRTRAGRGWTRSRTPSRSRRSAACGARSG